MTTTIRPMDVTDLAAVLNLSRSVPEAPWWSEAHVQQIVAEDERADVRHFRRGWVSLSSERNAVQGFLVLYALRIATMPGPILECEIESIVVHAEARRRGIGHGLLAAAIAWCMEKRASVLRLEVRSQNIAAIGLYQHAGFSATGARANYYRSPADDAVTMELRLRS